jgi:hypothetical protein
MPGGLGGAFGTQLIQLSHSVHSKPAIARRWLKSDALSTHKFVANVFARAKCEFSGCLFTRTNQYWKRFAKTDTMDLVFLLKHVEHNVWNIQTSIHARVPRRGSGQIGHRTVQGVKVGAAAQSWVSQCRPTPTRWLALARESLPPLMHTACCL